MYKEYGIDDFSSEEREILRKSYLTRKYKGKLSIKDINDIINEDRWENLYGGDKKWKEQE